MERAVPGGGRGLPGRHVDDVLGLAVPHRHEHLSRLVDLDVEAVAPITGHERLRRAERAPRGRVDGLDPGHPLDLPERHHRVRGPVVERVVDADQVVVELHEPALEERDVDAVRAQREIRQRSDGRHGGGPSRQQVGSVQHRACPEAAGLRHDERGLEPAVRVHGHPLRRHDVAAMLQLDRDAEPLSRRPERSTDREVVEQPDGARCQGHEWSHTHRDRRAVDAEGRRVHDDVRCGSHVDGERPVRPRRSGGDHDPGRVDDAHLLAGDGRLHRGDQRHELVERDVLRRRGQGEAGDAARGRVARQGHEQHQRGEHGDDPLACGHGAHRTGRVL